jgi:hypothetical protein
MIFSPVANFAQQSLDYKFGWKGTCKGGSISESFPL